MKNQYLCYKRDAHTVPCALTIDRSTNVVIHDDNGATFKSLINPSYSHSSNPVNLFFLCVFSCAPYLSHAIFCYMHLSHQRAANV